MDKFLVNLINEQKRISAHADNLEAFLLSPRSSKIDRREIPVLHEQLMAMKKYNEALIVRLRMHDIPV